MSVHLTLESAPEIEHILTCACSEVIMKSHGETEKVRAKVIILKGNQVFAVCKRCNAEVLLPLRKSIEEPDQVSIDRGPPLILDR